MDTMDTVFPWVTNTAGIRTLKDVDPTSTVMDKVTLAIEPRSGTSTIRISAPAKLRVRTESW